MADSPARGDLTGSGGTGPTPSAAVPGGPTTDPAGAHVTHAPTISLPQGGGAIRGIGEKLAANPVTGTASMSFPFAVTQGRSGFGPALSLSYDSGSGNGPFGFGWSLSTLAITRRTEKGLPRYDDDHDSDVFVLSGAEDLTPVDGDVAVVDGYRVRRYRPRVEVAYARIERWSRTGDETDVHWRSWSRDGVLTVFGLSARSRIYDPGDPRKIFTWLVSESRDTVGNAIVYEYVPDDSAGIDLSRPHERNRGPADDPRRRANRYLKRIRYGNRVPLLDATGRRPRFLAAAGPEWLFEVVLDYGDHDVDVPRSTGDRTWTYRPDPFSSYRAGFEVRNTRLCQRLLMFHHFPDEPGVGADCLVASTDLQYEQVGAGGAGAVRHRPGYSMLRRASQVGYRRAGDGYLRRSIPATEFEYSEAVVGTSVAVADRGALANLPRGIDGNEYRWVDLHGEGAPGILTEQAGGWFYRRNLSPVGAGFAVGPVEAVTPRPQVSLAGREVQLADLAGDGVVDVVVAAGPGPGVFRHDGGEGWREFRPFRRRPIPDPGPQTQLVDLDGDGRADMIVVESDALVWHRCEGDDGYHDGRRTPFALDDETGPRLVTADKHEAVVFADMTGDGLADLVRIRNGDVCYWPNLGFGRFGAKITMDGAPWFDRSDVFDPARVRVADVDGSGTADLLYLHADGVLLYANCSGNAWATPVRLPVFPHTDNLTSVAVMDLLGKGTACLVWSSPLPSDGGRQLQYVDLMGAKPHLLVRTVNNLGAESRVSYATSTHFALRDRAVGRPWLGKLPFPVHVVARIESIDRLSRSRFVTRRAYHDGWYDGVEREFRGFGMVEQWDAEEFAAFGASTSDDGAPRSDVPPVLTRTWFHLGGPDHPLWTNWPDPPLGVAGRPELPVGLTITDEREALRALKGAMVRREVYAVDGSAAESRPYAVTVQNLTVRCLQPTAAGDATRHGVFAVVPRETITYHDERDRDDPRVQHRLVVQADEFGNALRQVDVAYGRRRADPALPTDADRALQATSVITYTRHDFTNAVDDTDDYRTPESAQTRVYELTGVDPDGADGLFTVEAWRSNDYAAFEGLAEIPHPHRAEPGRARRRLIAHEQTRYRPDDLGVAAGDPLTLLPVGQVQSRALAGEGYRLAFTDALLDAVLIRDGQALLDRKARTEVLVGDGGYRRRDGAWWAPSGRVFLSSDPDDDAAAEWEFARRHFFLPCRYRDPFHRAEASTEAVVAYDRYDLLMAETIDCFGNRVTAGERTVDGERDVEFAGHDYRVLQPALVTDANGNRSAVAFDAFGDVVGLAVMGKRGETVGGSLDGFQPDLPDDVVRRVLADPLGLAAEVLGRASSRAVHDRFAFQRSGEAAVTLTVARERHASDLAEGEAGPLAYELHYFDGYAREIQLKKRAQGGPDAPSWLATGWTIFNDKGRPIRQYEPFHTDTHRFEFAVEVGVSSVIFYDPLGRVVATLHPDGTYEKAVFNAWGQVTWDANDTVLLDPVTDPDVAGTVAGYLAKAGGWSSWLEQRTRGRGKAPEAVAAGKSAAHAGTPGRVWFDALGREVGRVADNGGWGPVPSRLELDVQGNRLVVRDAVTDLDPLGRACLRAEYDLLGRPVHESSTDAGDRWTLRDVRGELIRLWDSRGHEVRSTYDRLRRPSRVHVRGIDPDRPTATVLTEEFCYGEAIPDAVARNLRGRLHVHRDEAGIATTLAVDFMGNVLVGTRQLVAAHDQVPDWAGEVALDDVIYEWATTWDALSRPVTVTAPHAAASQPSILRYRYGEGQLLDRIDAALPPRPADWRVFVARVDYNARGQRTRIGYGNGTTTDHEYDPLTFRTTRIVTRRAGAAVQDLRYTYDAVGNITHVDDRAQQTVFFRNRRVEPGSDYTYDAIYRLIEATGREHVGGGGPIPSGPADQASTGLPLPGDGQALARYVESYSYDAVDNITTIRHRGTHPRNAGWTRELTYDPTSNRLHSAGLTGAPTEAYIYDAHGNMTQLPHLHALTWDHRNRLRTVQREATDDRAERTYYTYDSGGERIRKITVHRSGEVREERVYLAGVEIYRRLTGPDRGLVRETLHVRDDRGRVALVETRNDVDDGTRPQVVRFQYSDHVGSATLELDDEARVISYEEYTPYGATAYQASRGRTEAPKRYRFCGKERDEESGLNYHGARYYAPWLGRWISPDPLGLADGPNMFGYGRANPIAFADPNGTDCDPTMQSCADPTTETPREEAMQECIAGPERYLPPPLETPTSSSAMLEIQPVAAGTDSDSALSGWAAASLGINATSGAVRIYFRPRNAVGDVLTGDLLLYTGSAARADATLARAAGQGYMIGDTVYAGPADAAEMALRARLGIPTGTLPTAEYNAIWGEASRLAVRDFAVSGGGVATFNDPATLSQTSIQAVYELPTYRNYGAGMGGLNVLGGGFSIYGASQDENDARAALGYTGGGLQVAGGGMMIWGAFNPGTTARLFGAGRVLGTVGAVVTAPIVAWQAYDDLSSGDEYRQLRGTLNAASIVAPPAAVLSVYNDVVVQPAAETFYQTARGAISQWTGVPMS
ncbi:MAG: SpvB/TcaC N-terminal domain-containing protein, partial [Micromonosporaceae bacterium]